ncbi:isoleucine--tRNA ligase [Methanobrevibacter curvatus]|uniref:Isoleucine--tRNA ligase n=1 Tax=Methanobrevibacter curvatus TaxID=49547 RepID=A0A166A5P2_9EURY|nr:isoleucine--tRNA ligase [Methanobrevibacter curvatus]KZX11606.1 isoleucine--tRNA ligase [Methanobrevibacter curvatus]
MSIQEANKSVNHKELEKKIQDFWKKNEIYLNTKKLRGNGPQYSFLDGPPYCSGVIHLGTAWNKIIKDTHLRYKSMNGFNIKRQPGWDAHGLPIEHKVEQLLNISNKQEIEEEYGIANFVDKCKEFAIKNKDAMTAQFESLGVWMDWNKPYITIDPKYIESAWWTLKKASQKNLLVKDLRVVSACPRCETALAAAEIDYSNEIDPSIYVKFPLDKENSYGGNSSSNNNNNNNNNNNSNSNNNNAFNGIGEDIYFLVWTTTPWTLPANLAISFNPKFIYSLVKFEGEVLILAESLIEEIFEDKEYEIIKTVSGDYLEGLSYIPPLLDEIPKQREFKSIKDKDKNSYLFKLLPGNHVELSEGTGLVHTAPGHGPDDFEMGQKYSLPIFSPITIAGKYSEDGGKYTGQFIKDADNTILDDLEEKKVLFKQTTIEHRFGHCWRCKTPIIYLATEQWFLKITEIKDKMLSQLDNVEWIPEWAGQSRFRDWVENARDWTISRQRYWGIPISVWECPDCGEIKVVGSVDELKENSIDKIKVKDEELLHRPAVDDIKIKCHKTGCNGVMSRVPDVLDVWIDSGVAGWASKYYPKEKDAFNQWYPYDFITEGHDQTRGWFYSQLGAGVVSMDRVPYKKVLMHGFVLDEDGKKMSKSLGNVVSPEEVIEKVGADVLRFYILWASKPWDDLKFVWDELNNINKMFSILWNVYVFSTTYMALDNFNPDICSEDKISLRDEDRWIISRANLLVKHVGKDLNDLYFHKATRRINKFILDDLSRWYVRLIRGRTWKETDDPDKLGAYFSLYTALDLLIKAMAPITPHLAEEIYQNLCLGVKSDSSISVHMEDWKYDDEAIDENLESNMDVVRHVIEAAARGRDVARYKLRWPVKEITIVSQDENILNAVNSLVDVIKDQSNTKNVVTLKEYPNLSFNAEPNMKLLGKKLRQDVKIVKTYLTSNDGSRIKEELDKNGKIIIEDENITINDEKTIELNHEEIIFESELPEDVVSSDFEGGNVFINTEVTGEIYSEAMVREIIRRIQDMRKDLDLDVEAHIDVLVQSSDKFDETVESQIDIISSEVRANSIEFKDISSVLNNKILLKKEWKIEDEELTIAILN